MADETIENKDPKDLTFDEGLIVLKQCKLAIRRAHEAANSADEKSKIWRAYIVVDDELEKALTLEIAKRTTKYVAQTEILDKSIESLQSVKDRLDDLIADIKAAEKLIGQVSRAIDLLTPFV